MEYKDKKFIVEIIDNPNLVKINQAPVQTFEITAKTTRGAKAQGCALLKQIGNKYHNTKWAVLKDVKGNVLANCPGNLGLELCDWF